MNPRPANPLLSNSQKVSALWGPRAWVLAASLMIFAASFATANAAPDRPAAAESSSDFTFDSSGKARVQILLTDNSIVKGLGRAKSDLRYGSSPRAQLANRNPNILTDQERSLARQIENRRNAGLATVRRAAASGSAQSELVAREIKRNGGDVIDAIPLPNSIVANVSRSALGSLLANPNVAGIRASVKPVLLSNPIDGSQTWHDNGFTGNGPSLDTKGGPDYLPWDSGVRTTHNAFRTRLPGDSPTGPATGPSRVISPQGRTDFSGSEHGNQVAATVAATDLTVVDDVVDWPYRKGLAYGVDKLYDEIGAKSANRWMLGITYDGEPGVTDIPEVTNYSFGFYQDNVDLDPISMVYDGEVEHFNVAWTIAAGNCGIANSGFNGCNTPGGGPHRVAAPSTSYNVLTLGGLDTSVDPYNSNTWQVWANSSPGPTYGGRKKPDLIASPYGSVSCPNDQNDTTFENCGIGTSYAAPIGAAGALLLASSGVYAPTAQRAILINSATPIQGQTYWMPRSGWGALNLDSAFYQRGNYFNGNVTPQGSNGTRFYRATGVASGDRTTLAWNRRTDDLGGDYDYAYRAPSNLDLQQVNSSTGANTGAGGSDAADAVDTSGAITADNPMPGSGVDGEDNVEQVRSTSSGTQVFKVRAMGPIDGAASEPFSIASAKPMIALATPVPTVALSVSQALAGTGDPVTVTATTANTSADIPLTSAAVTLTVPSGVAITSSPATQALGTLTSAAPSTVTWQVQGSTEGIKALSAAAAGTAYGETFTGSGAAQLTVDDSPPVVTVTGPGAWSADASAPFTWSGADTSAIASYDVSVGIAGAVPTLTMDNTTATSGAFAAAEGQSVEVQVAATDAAGNTSTAVSATTTIDAAPPSISLGAPSLSGGAITVPITASNVGSPITTTYAFSTSASPPLAPLTSGQATFTAATLAAASAVLRVQATDQLGRATTAAQTYSIPSRLRAASIALAKPKKKGKYLLVSGSIDKSASGYLTITAKRKGKKGTKRLVKRVKITSGRFGAKLELAAGSYRLTTAYSGSSDVHSGTAVKTFRLS